MLLGYGLVLMRNLHLVDVQYLKDLDLILKEELPRCVVEVGCWDGFLLQHAYKYLKSITPETPLEVIALVQDKSDIDSVRHKLQDIPHKIALLEAQNTIEEPCLSIVAFQEGYFIGESQIALQKHTPGTIREYLLEKAGLGYFPKPGQCFHYKDTFTLANFEKKQYKARKATLDDLPKLTMLEEASWVKGLANPISILEKRIQDYPEGQIVLELDNQIVAAIYSSPKGEMLQFLSINVLPEKQKLGLASSLLEFCLQLAEVDGIQEAIGITRCASYPGPDVMPQHEYIHNIQADGRPQDPVLRMHVGRGGVIKKLVANYRPEDIQNQGYGVLVYYPLNKRTIYKTQKTPSEQLQPVELYETVWKNAPEAPKKPLQYDRLWLIFANRDDPQAYKLREMLCEARQYCILVEPGNCFEQKNNESFTVDPLSPDDFAPLFSSLKHLSQLSGVIYLWGGLAKDENISVESLEALHKPSLTGLTNLANALDFYVSPNTCKLFVASYLNLVTSPLLGLAKVIQIEYPQLQCSYFASDLLAEHLFDELQIESYEPIVAWKEGRRQVLRMVRAEIPPTAKIQFNPDSSYLLAGAFRLLSLKVAEWYAAHGAKNLILIDSWDITEAVEEVKNHLEAQGVRVGLYKMSMYNLDELKKVTAEFPPLDGVIHFAPMINDQLLKQVNWEKYKEIYEIRVLGSWALHELTKELTLDHFVLFSSAVTDFSFSGKAALGAASSFLDALSHYRKGISLPALAIDWGLWSLKNVSFIHLTETRRLKERIEPFNTEHAFTMLERILHYPKAQVTAAIINWKLVVDNPLFSEIAR